MKKTGAKAVFTEFDKSRVQAVKSLMKVGLCLHFALLLSLIQYVVMQSCDVLEDWYSKFQETRLSQSSDAKADRYNA